MKAMLCLLAAVMWLSGCSAATGGGRGLDGHDAAVELQALIDAAEPGSTVTLPPGRHVLKRGLFIEHRRGLVLIAPAGTQILVDDVNADVLTIDHSSDIIIDGGQYAHLKPLTEYQCHGDVVKVRDSQRVTLRRATLLGCGAIGVSAWHVSNLTVQSCDIRQNTFNALYLDDCDEVRLWDNLITGNGNTLQTSGVSQLEASGNHVHGDGGYWRQPALQPGPGGYRPQPMR